MHLIDRTLDDFDAIRRSFQWSIPSRLNITQQVCDRHQHNGQQIALYYENGAGETACYSFAQLQRLTNRFANALSGLGVTRGDRVAVILSQRIETLVAHLACFRIGAVTLPMAVLFGPDAIEYRLRDSGAVVAITDSSKYDTLAELQNELPAMRHLIGCHTGDKAKEFWQLVEKSNDNATYATTYADDPACLIYTSGTTGLPKGALIAHRAIIGNLTGFEMSQNFFPQSGDLFWTPADWAWTGGLWDALLPSLNYGVPILAYEDKKFDPERASQLMGRYGVTNAFIPPTALKMLRQVANLKQQYKVRLRAVMSAGEQVGEELLRWGSSALDVVVNEMWGQTEFNYLVGNCSEIMRPKPGSMGKPYPGHLVDVIDEEGRVLPPGEHGELAAWRNDPVMFLGYWNNEQATQDKFTGDWFRTGDIGYRDEDGYLWFFGRKDDVITSSGYRIGPGEIEDSLLKHPAVLQAAVIGKPDELRGNIVKAFIVLAPGQAPSAELSQEIQRTVRERLSAHEYPREIEFIDELPMTTSGKVRRLELRNAELNK